MKRRRSVNRIELDRPIIEQIKEIKAEHPFWGYRRIWAYLRFRQKVVVGKNRIYRLMKENNILVPKNLKLKAKRHSNRKKPRAKIPNQFWGMDMTKVKLQTWGWLYIHAVLDWCTKEIIGFHVSSTSKTNDWLEALDMAINNRFPNGILEARFKPKLITDNGCQPTSCKFMQSCSTYAIKQIFTTWNNPKGNADTERVFRTLKEDLVWPREWNLPFEFEKDLIQWIHDYNTDFPHQSLGYKTPAQMATIFNEKKLRKEVKKRENLSLILA
jgi:putative transposase